MLIPESTRIMQNTCPALGLFEESQMVGDNVELQENFWGWLEIKATWI